MAPDATPDLDLTDGVLAPLWRGLVGYRVLALGYAAALVVSGWAQYRRPVLAALVLVLAAGWTAVTTYGYLRRGPGRRGPGRRDLGSSRIGSSGVGRLGVGRLALADLVVTVAAVGCTPLTDTPARIAAGAPVLTSVWSAGAPIALALALGPLPGLLGALAVQAGVLVVRGSMGNEQLTDLLLLVAAALAVGYAGTVLRRSADELRRAIELRAAVAERERLARTIHDGVLQVLAQVHRRGRAAGGAAAELGVLAGEQEVALRTLIGTGPPAVLPTGRADLADAMSRLAATRVTVSVPGTPVVLPAHTVAETVAATRAALANVTEHVGADAPVWILLEDIGDRVLVSVRDDGPGIPEGRLAAAEAQGRLGVSGSIRGRIETLGGTAVCETGPGMGTEWTFEVPR